MFFILLGSFCIWAGQFVLMDFADMNMVAVSTDNAVDDVDDDDEWDEETRSQKDHELLAQRETKALRLLRALLGLTLLVSTALASWLVFRFMRRAEQRTMLSEVSRWHSVVSIASKRCICLVIFSF